MTSHPKLSPNLTQSRFGTERNRVLCSDQLLEKAVADEGGRVVIGEIARLVRIVYPSLRNTTILQTAYKASDTNSDGSMDLKQFETMLKHLVLFNNEARTFEGA